MTHVVSFGVNYMVRSKQIEQYGWMNYSTEHAAEGARITLVSAHVFKTFGAYQLPIGRGRLVNTPNQAVDMIVGGMGVLSPTSQYKVVSPFRCPGTQIPLPHNKPISHPNWSQPARCVRGEDAYLDYVPGGSPVIPACEQRV